MTEAASHIVVMGVSGCGKTTIGKQLAARLGLPFADADDFHSVSNLQKMASGLPLNDEDRAPWLDAVGRWLAGAPRGAVIACSALRIAYRERIRTHCPSAWFLLLHGPMPVAAQRVAGRTDHFMPAELVRSQYDALEPLAATEAGLRISFEHPVPTIVDAAMASMTADG